MKMSREERRNDSQWKTKQPKQFLHHPEDPSQYFFRHALHTRLATLNCSLSGYSGSALSVFECCSLCRNSVKVARWSVGWSDSLSHLLSLSLSLCPRFWMVNVNMSRHCRFPVSLWSLRALKVTSLLCLPVIASCQGFSASPPCVDVTESILDISGVRGR